MRCERNAFGRQLRSFEADLELAGLDARSTRCSSARRGSPRHGPGVEVLAEVDGHPSRRARDNVVVVAFHPELAGETSACTRRSLEVRARARRRARDGPCSRSRPAARRSAAGSPGRRPWCRSRDRRLPPNGWRPTIAPVIGAVDVEVADRRAARRRAPRCAGCGEQPAGQREGQLVDAVAGVVDVADALDGQQRAEDLLAAARASRRAGRRPRAAGEPARGRDAVAVGGEPSGSARELGVALDALLRRRARSRAARRCRTRRPGRPGARRPRRRAARSARRRSPRARARARRRCTSGRRRRSRWHDRGHGVVEVGVGVDDHAVLAAHLGDDALEVAAAAARRRRCAGCPARPGRCR